MDNASYPGVRKNKNRGYQQLRVWQDAVALYCLTSDIFQRFPFQLAKIARETIASVDSVHRNIAEGYCRKSVNEYLNFLNIARGSLGESVSSYHTYRKAKQLSEEQFDKLDALSFKVENGLLKLIESLERKRGDGGWIDALFVKESNALYEEA